MSKLVPPHGGKGLVCCLLEGKALEDEKKDATVETVQSIIAADGEVEKVDVWGMRKLAYPINDETEGYYVIYTFSSQPDYPAELSRRFNITDGVLRSLVTVID